MDFELKVEQCYSHLLRPGDLAIDAGANIGRHTAPISMKVGPKGRVHAIEPVPETMQQLKNNCKHETNINFFEVALGETSAEAEFNYTVDAPWYSGLQKRIYDVPTTIKKILVKVCTLDQMFLELENLRYIKMDLEGGEYHALLGGMQTIMKHRPIVSIEFGLAAIEQYGIDTEMMATLIYKRLDYNVVDILGRSLSEGGFAQSAINQEVWDYICIPREQEKIRFEMQALLGAP